MPAIHSQGLNKLLTHMRTLITHIGVSDDQTPYSSNQTRLDPTETANNLILPTSHQNVDNVTDDYTINVTSANFGGNTIYTIGAQSGPAATDNISRSVRNNGIGIEPSGDDFNIGVRFIQSDQTP